MKKRTFKFQCRIEQLLKLLAHGPLTYDQMFKACGFDPQPHIKVMTGEGLMRVRKEQYGVNGNFFRNVYFVDSAPQKTCEDINGWSDSLRVMMGYTPMKPISIEGNVTIFDDIDYYEQHRDDIRRQAPCIGVMRFGSMQSSFGDLEIYGAA